MQNSKGGWQRAVQVIAQAARVLTGRQMAGRNPVSYTHLNDRGVGLNGRSQYCHGPADQEPGGVFCGEPHRNDGGRRRRSAASDSHLRIARACDARRWIGRAVQLLSLIHI